MENQIFTEPTWVILELFGKESTAGLITPTSSPFIRLDIPATDDSPGATQILHENAVFRISPTDEKTARAYLQKGHPKPFNNWTIHAAIDNRVDELTKRFRAGNETVKKTALSLLRDAFAAGRELQSQYFRDGVFQPEMFENVFANWVSVNANDDNETDGFFDDDGETNANRILFADSW